MDVNADPCAVVLVYNRPTNSMLVLIFELQKPGAAQSFQFYTSALPESLSSLKSKSLLSYDKLDDILSTVPSGFRLVSAADRLDAAGLLAAINSGLDLHSPELCEEGVNGTYFLRDTKGEIVAVFKPNDEQGDSKHNPKKSDDDTPISKGIVNDIAHREVAAYLLDKDLGFFGVPKTFLVSTNHSSFKAEAKPKVGSVQEFINNDGSSSDFGPRLFPVDEVHKIGILDLRIFNADRHSGNVLVQQTDESVKLIPIDHGFSLPPFASLSQASDNLRFEWMNWPQAKQPFSEAMKSFISKIDVEEDCLLLKSKLGLADDCLKTMKVSTMLLKNGAAKGLTLYQIGSMLCRDFDEEKSTLEIMCERAAADVQSACAKDRESFFFQRLERIMDEQMQKVTCL